MIGLAARLLGLPRLLRTITARVPSGYWKTLAVLVLLGCAWFGHTRAVSSARSDERKRTDAEWQQAFDTMRVANQTWRRLAETRAAAISRDIGERHAQDLRDLADRAAALRLRGPGKAAICAGPSSASGPAAASGGRIEAGGTGDASVADVRDGEAMAAVPWADLAEAGARCDANRLEVIAWRENYERQLAAWTAARAAVKSGQK